mmetsp:Transcript_13471/g.49012  ORF Transcript_13471/g.49012 Transcript_13471/m.49012 type:complete len:203 (-) Transcript_13471:13-621(-)
MCSPPLPVAEQAEYAALGAGAAKGSEGRQTKLWQRDSMVLEIPTQERATTATATSEDNVVGSVPVIDEDTSSCPPTPTTPSSPATVTRLLHISLSGIRKHTPGSFSVIKEQQDDDESAEDGGDNGIEHSTSGASSISTSSHVEDRQRSKAGQKSVQHIRMAPTAPCVDLRRALFHCKISNEMLVKYDKYQRKMAEENEVGSS